MLPQLKDKSNLKEAILTLLDSIQDNLLIKYDFERSLFSKKENSILFNQYLTIKTEFKALDNINNSFNDESKNHINVF